MLLVCIQIILDLAFLAIYVSERGRVWILKQIYTTCNNETYFVTKFGYPCSYNLWDLAVHTDALSINSVVAIYKLCYTVGISFCLLHIFSITLTNLISATAMQGIYKSSYLHANCLRCAHNFPSLTFCFQHSLSKSLPTCTISVFFTLVFLEPRPGQGRRRRG